VSQQLEANALRFKVESAANTGALREVRARARARVRVRVLEDANTAALREAARILYPSPSPSSSPSPSPSP